MRHNPRYSLEVSDYALATELEGKVTLGRYFVFTRPGAHASSGRASRLQLETEGAGCRVHPFVEGRLSLPGLTLCPQDVPLTQPLACLVSDRDLYRAEEDTVYLYAVVAAPVDRPKRIDVRQAGATVLDLDLALDAGCGVATLEVLSAGSYEAQLYAGDSPLGEAAHFTVAEYTLAPLNACLVSHSLDRTHDALRFELSVDSYALPFSGKLRVSLVEGARVVSKTVLRPSEAGRYEGELSLQGEGPFRLQIVAADDAERSAELPLPGARQSEREETLICELGPQAWMSLMPGDAAQALRSTWLREGDRLRTALSVREVICDEGVIEAHQEIHDLVLIVHDAASGRRDIRRVGSLAAGEQVAVPVPAPMCTVFVGAWIDDRPFEGYASFVRPESDALSLTLDVPASVRPQESVEVTVRCPQEGTVALLSICDDRLTTSRSPDYALAAALKGGVDAQLKGYGEAFAFEEVPVVGPVFGGLPGGVPKPAPMSFSGAADMEDFELLERGAGGATLEESVAILRDALERRRSQPRPQFKLKSEAPDAEAPDEPQTRTVFPQQLFFGLVEIADGEAQLEVPVGEGLGTFRIEAFAFDRGDWRRAEARFEVDQPVRADLQLPDSLYPGDVAQGRLRVATRSGRAEITLSCDGAPVAFDTPETLPAEIAFAARPGLYAATVQDPEHDESDRLEQRVQEMGTLRTLHREVLLLEAGQRCDLSADGALSLRLLPGLDESFNQLVSATASYAHLCCEQTAAKMVAAALMFLTAETPQARLRAERIIIKGAQREKKMWLPGRGFSMYPNGDDVSRYWSPLAVRHLRVVQLLQDTQEMSLQLRSALGLVETMAGDAGRAHALERIPAQIEQPQDAYTIAQHASHRRSEALEYVRARVDLEAAGPRDPLHAVLNRELLAYAAATLLRLGETSPALRLAREVTSAFNEGGRLYSTVDSVAAIALFVELQRSGIMSGDASVCLDEGAPQSARELANTVHSPESIQVHSGVVAVERTRLVEERWEALSSNVNLKLSIQRKKRGWLGTLEAGERVTLRAEIGGGYREGDLLHIQLPPALSALQGGGRLQRLSVDFEGHDALDIPLLVGTPPEGEQHFVACLRNMFEEERVGWPGVQIVR